MEELNNFITQYKDWIVSLAGIGTFIASLIAIFTLREVKKQRLSLYQPDLRIKSFNISTNKSPLLIKENELLCYKVTDFNDYEINFNEVKFEINPNYKLENLGFGVAKNVRCIWKFNHKKAMKMIEEIKTQDFIISGHKNLNYYFLNRNIDDGFQYSSISDIYNQLIDYVAPISIRKNTHYHAIPEIILFCHLLYVIFKLELTGSKGENFNFFELKDVDFPKPSLIIEYFDLNRKKYTEKFDFEVSAIATQIDNTLELDKEFMYLNFEIKH